jgi:hypothetical protein
MDVPAPIQSYFDANARLDRDGMLTPFAETAVVRDEQRTHAGLDAIRRWIDETSIALPAVATPHELRSDGDRHSIVAQVSGNFPGSPVALSFHFRLANGRIAELEIR